MDVVKYYDLIANVYDLFTERFYAPMRRDLVQALDIQPGDKILVPACGTGSIFPYLMKYIGNEGLIVGVDISEKMLSRAQKKLRRYGRKNIKLVRGDAAKADAAFFRSHSLPDKYDVVIGELAFSVIPEWETAMQNAVNLLHPGGKAGILDWECPSPNPFTRLVNWLAYSDCSRPVFETFKRLLGDARVLRRYFFGYIFVATGSKKNHLRT